VLIPESPLPVPQDLPILYSFRRCPYAMRARLALWASQQVVAHREIVLKNKPAAMLDASPKGTVPVLVLPDGAVLEQSIDIMQWALQKNDPLAWWPQDAATLQAAQALIAQNDGDFKSQLDRYKYPHRFGLDSGLGARDEGAHFMEQLNQHLNAQAFLAGSHWGYLDAAIAPFVRQFAHTDALWFENQNWKSLRQWLSNFEASSAFDTVMQKHPVWQAHCAA
jgi:glutathione S-transferase